MEIDRRQAASQSRKSAPRRYTLSSGEPLSLENVRAAQESRRSHVIVVAGPVGSGKTTLVAAMYEAFGAGPAFGQAFAGSETLVAFERRCFDSRVASGLEVATTVRTRSGDEGYFHLALSPERADPARLHLYLHDVSGEIYREMIAKPASAASIEAFRVADRIQVTLDGERLVGLGTRDRETYRSRALVRAIAEYGGLRSSAKVDIVVTKKDLLAASPGAEVFAKQAAAEISEALPKELTGEVLVVCARSATPNQVPSLDGLEGVIGAWAGQLNAGAADPRREQVASA